MLAAKYIELYERMTARPFAHSDEPIAARVVKNLKMAGHL